MSSSEVIRRHAMRREARRRPIAEVLIEVLQLLLARHGEVIGAHCGNLHITLMSDDDLPCTPRAPQRARGQQSNEDTDPATHNIEKVVNVHQIV